MEAGLVAGYQVGLGLLRERCVSGGDADDLVVAALLRNGGVQQAGLDGPGAALAPEGGDHLLDHGQLDVVGRAEDVQKLGDKLVEALARFVAEHDASGKQTVADGVHRRPIFPSGVTGPRERAPLARDAETWSIVDIHILNHSI